MRRVGRGVVPKATKKDTRGYGAYVKVTFDLFVPVDGGNIDDALTAAKTLKPTDCLEVVEGIDYNDSAITLEGVHICY